MRKFIFFSTLALAFSALACNLSSSSSPASSATPGADSTVATLVAQQLTAVVQSTPANQQAVLATATTAPLFSGLEVVYTKSGNIWLWNGSSASQLTSSGLDSAPKLSDDGLVIAFVRNGELWAINADGKNERVLASAGGLAALPHTGAGPVEPRQVEFAPRSHDIYLNITVVGDPFSLPEDNLAKVNADSPSLVSLFDSGLGSSQFVFSPDGTKIALVGSEKISVANADGSGLKTVFTFPMVMMYSEFNYILQIVWMPDGSGFKTVIPAPDALGDPSAPTRFMYVPASGGQAAQLAIFTAVPAFQDRPYISPDGSKVMYMKPNGNMLELHVIDASTADLVYFSYPADHFGVFGWTPDSKGITFWVDDNRSAWLFSDNNKVPLSDVTYGESVTWLDAGRYLFVNESELRIRSLSQPSVLIDSNVSGGFDFALPLVK